MNRRGGSYTAIPPNWSKAMKRHFEFKSAYMGSTDFLVTERGVQYRLSLRTALDDYERAVLNPVANNIRDTESSIGLLRSFHFANGQPPQDVVDDFNHWRLSEYTRIAALMRANPERYGDYFGEPPTPVKAGCYSVESGWTPVEPESSNA